MPRISHPLPLLFQGGIAKLVNATCLVLYGLLVLNCGLSEAQEQTSSEKLKKVELYAAYGLWSGNYPVAISNHQEWLRLRPKSLRAEIGLSRSYRGVHNFDEARTVLEQAIRDHPRNPEPLASLGDLDIELQDYGQAIRHLTSALAFSPSDVESLNRLAVAYKGKGDIPGALAQIAKVLANDSKNALAYFTRAQIYSDQDRDALALRDAEKVVELQPNNRHALILLAKILLRMPERATPESITQRCSRAVQVLEPLVFRKPHDISEPLTLYRNVPPDDPENLYILFDQPGGTEKFYLLSRAYACAGKPEKAQETLADFETFSKKDRTSKENRTQAKHLVEQANALAQKNDLPGALDLLQQALTKDPMYGPANSQLAKIYYSEGDLEKADDAIGQALQSDPYQPDFLYVQGKILEKEGNLDQALAAFQQTALVNPNESDAYFEMGVIYQQKNDREHALAAYKKAVELSPDDLDYKRAVDSLRAQK